MKCPDWARSGRLGCPCAELIVFIFSRKSFGSCQKMYKYFIETSEFWARQCADDEFGLRDLGTPVVPPATIPSEEHRLGSCGCWS